MVIVTFLNLKLRLFIETLLLSLGTSGPDFIDKNTNETLAIEFLDQYNEKLGKLLNEYTKASWNYETNITDENDKLSQEAGFKVSTFLGPRKKSKFCVRFFFHFRIAIRKLCFYSLLNHPAIFCSEITVFWFQLHFNCLFCRFSL